MFRISDRVKESSSSTGTGAVVLGGAYSGFQTFLNGVGDGKIGADAANVRAHIVPAGAGRDARSA